jgi:cholesterol transport system auxiliary component
MNYAKEILIAFILLLISSCSILSPVKSANEGNYQLTHIPAVPKKQTRPISLLVLKPDTNSIYSSNKIVYTNKPYQISYFAKNYWAETPANMLQGLMIQTLQNTHYYRAVVSPPFAGHYDYILNTQLVELKQDFTHLPSTVSVILRAQIVQTSTGRIIAAKQFSDTEIAPQNSPCGGVLAANRAVENILQQLARFCLLTTR